MQTLTAPAGGHYPELWPPAPERVLWHDDASYAAYQAADPYAWCDGFTDEDWAAYDAAREADAEWEDSFGWAARRDWLNGQDEDREAMERYLDEPPCDHGLDAWLCGGWDHYATN